MSSEWIKHDGSRRCPVEEDAIVFFSNDFGEDTCPASMINWTTISEYEIIQGWDRSLADIFAELPTEAEWINTDINGAFVWAPSEPKLGERCFVNPDGWAHAQPPAIHHGDWRESKRKRPEAKRTRAFDLAREATAGQLDSLKEIIKRGGVKAVLNDYGHKVQQSDLEKDLQERFAEKPAPWFVLFDDEVLYGGDEEQCRTYIDRESEHSFGRQMHLCRAVASFTAKVERTTYENGGE